MLEHIQSAQADDNVCMHRWMTWTMPSASRALRRPARPSLLPRAPLTPPLPLSEERPPGNAYHRSSWHLNCRRQADKEGSSQRLAVLPVSCWSSASCLL